MMQGVKVYVRPRKIRGAERPPERCDEKNGVVNEEEDEGREKRRIF